MKSTTASGAKGEEEPPPPARPHAQPEPLLIERHRPLSPVDIITLCHRTMVNWRLALVGMTVGLAITAAVIALRKPLYRSETTIAYREGIEGSYVGSEGDPLRNLASRLRETLLSRSNLAPIVDQFNLYPAKMERGGHVAAVDEFRNHIQFRPRSVDTFVIAFDSTTQELTQPVTARLASVLVDDIESSGRTQTKITVDFLSAERLHREAELREREEALARFLTEHPEFAEEATPGASVRAAERRDQGDPTLGALQRQLPRLRGSTRGAAAPLDPRLAAAKADAQQELRIAQQQLTEQSARFTDLHPDVQAAARRVGAARSQLAQAEAALAAEQTLMGSEREQVKSRAQIDQLKADIAARKRQMRTEKFPKGKEALSKTTDRIVAAETEHARLSRELSEARSRVEVLDGNLAMARMAENSKVGGYGPRIEVLDPAYMPPTPATMRRFYIALIGLGSSVFLGIAAAAAFGVLFEKRILRAADLLELSLPVLAVVPKESSRAAESRASSTPLPRRTRLTQTLQGIGEVQNPGRAGRRVVLDGKK